MYKVDSDGWLKHFDFLLIDMFCLQAAFAAAYVLSGHTGSPYADPLYRYMALFIELADVIVIFAGGTLKNVLKRGHYREAVITLKHSIELLLVSVLYLFVMHMGEHYSRLALLIMFVIYTVSSYITRELRKLYIHKKAPGAKTRALLIVTTAKAAADVIARINNLDYAGYKTAGIAVLDADMTGQSIDGVQVVANSDTAAEYVCHNWIDEVLVVTADSDSYPERLMSELIETGVTVHLNLANVGGEPGRKQFIEKIGGYTVVTTSMNFMSAKQLLMKRLMDIAGGIAGCILTAIIFVFIAPVIYAYSPGPIFFTQERVGRNGKKFKMYKFRSMYLDAEERKAELMKDNKLGDAKMFKMDFDPRVIGNRVLPDGTRKTGIGDFIRRTSIDEFPQFYNVLKGDMSIVGTRPPLVSETSLYELHHRARLAIKPGITGMWQICGRSDITDFEEVVRLDKEYISNWNIGLDIKILLKTVLVVLKKQGAE